MHAALTVNVTKEAASSSHELRVDRIAAAAVCLLPGVSCVRIIPAALARMFRRTERPAMVVRRQLGG
jgi:hypothetical protein